MAASTLVSWLQIAGWEQENEPAFNDFNMILFFALFFPTARFFLDRILLERLGKRFVIGSTKHLSQAELEERQKKHIKFKESGWKWIYFLSGELFALAVTYNEPWFTDTKKFWIGPGDQVWPDQKVKTKLKALYMYTGGFYTYSIFALVFWETRRSDFGINMGHHVATVLLIVFSYMAKFARVGSVVLSLHDASDVFLELGKMAKYTGSNLLASLAFIVFAVSWVVLRLIYFPFWVIWSTSYEVLQILDREKHKKDGPLLYYAFNSLLMCLLVINIYWWGLIFRMLVKQIQAKGELVINIYWWGLIFRMLVKQIQAKGELGEDVRSDSEGEEKDD